MPRLVSVQILCGVKVLRDWNVIAVDESWTLRRVFEGLANGMEGLDEGDSWTLDAALFSSPLVCKVGTSRKGDFQRILLSLAVGDALEFGKYFRFILQGGGEGSGLGSVVKGSGRGPTLDAFAIMLSAAADVHLPPLNTVATKNNLLLLKNDFVKYLQEKKLGWSADTVELHGTPFVRKMGEVLWHIDGQHAKLKAQQAPIPECFLQFSGYNDPVSRKQKPQRLDRAKLETLADDLFDILQQQWMSTYRWQEMKKDIATLADSLQKYAKYLKHQSQVVSTNHKHQESVRDLATSTAPQLLPLKPAVKVTDAAKFERLIQELTSRDKYEPVLLNEMLPSDKRECYRYIESLRQGLPLRAMLYTHSSGNNVGNTHFIWRVPDEQPENEVLAHSASVILQVQEQIPHFHTRAMRSRFIQVFGLVTGVKPAILREMYRQLTGDNSSAHDEEEAQINGRVRLAIDMEDPDVIIDLRAHNQGQPSRYDVFWDACRTYIEDTAGVSVDDRRHDHICHLAAAMSVSDLRKQVCT